MSPPGFAFRVMFYFVGLTRTMIGRFGTTWYFSLGPRLLNQIKSRFFFDHGELVGLPKTCKDWFVDDIRRL